MKIGVESAALKGTNKDEIEVVGDMVDAVELTKSLRKNLGYAELVSVAPATGSDQKKAEEKKKEATMAAVAWPTYTYGGVQPYYAYQVPNHEPSCSVMWMILSRL